MTGMSNFHVAKYLLENGLPMDGVVFLDSADRKMILVRSSMTVMELSQSGIPRHSRFTFFDHIHTTGMDIPQCLNACAALTIGKVITLINNPNNPNKPNNHNNPNNPNNPRTCAFATTRKERTACAASVSVRRSTCC